MAQKVTFRFGNADSTKEWNDRWTNIVSDGVYEGFLVSQADTPSMFCNISSGTILTKEGIKIAESVDLNEIVEVNPAHPTRRRVDLVCVYHKYATVPTVPLGNFAEYVVIEGDIEGDDLTPPTAPYDKISMYHVPLAEIRLPAGATFITDAMIFNTRRTPTTRRLSDEVSETFYYAWGNFSYEGWDVSDGGILTAIVSPGAGLLCGRLNRSATDYAIHSLRPRGYIRLPEDPDTHVPYQVGANLTLTEQPDFPTKLRIEISSPTVAVGGKIYISGTNEFGEELLNQEVLVSQSAGDVVVYETEVHFGYVYLEGIDAHELIVPGHEIYINIKDKPVHRIYAVGTEVGTPIFRAELDPGYQPLCNELLLGVIETDENGIISVEDLDTNPLAEYVDHLSPQCDGAKTVFFAQSIPVENTDSLWIDGLQVFRDETPDWSLTFGKGYKLSGTQVTLGPLNQPPDTNTVLVLRYRRHN